MKSLEELKADVRELIDSISKKKQSKFYVKYYADRLKNEVISIHENDKLMWEIIGSDLSQDKTYCKLGTEDLTDLIDSLKKYYSIN